MSTSLQIKVAGLLGYVLISTSLVLAPAEDAVSPVQAACAMVSLP